MCEDKNCHCGDSKCGSKNCKCHEYEKIDYDELNERNAVGEADFEIIDKDELAQIGYHKENVGNLGDDLVKLGFLDENDDLYKEMKKEKRNGKVYEI